MFYFLPVKRQKHDIENMFGMKYNNIHFKIAGRPWCGVHATNICLIMESQMATHGD